MVSLRSGRCLSAGVHSPMRLSTRTLWGSGPPYEYPPPSLGVAIGARTLRAASQGPLTRAGTSTWSVPLPATRSLEEGEP